MRRDEHLDFILRCLSAEQRELLQKKIPSLPTKAAVAYLYDRGDDFFINSSIPTTVITRRRKELIRQHPDDAEADFGRILALLYFELALEHLDIPISNIKLITPTKIGHQRNAKDSTIYPKSPVSRRCFIKHGVGAASSLMLVGNRRGSINEERVKITLEEAQKARWRCDYSEVYRLLGSLDRELDGGSSPITRFWKSKTLDLRVETLFTVSEASTFTLSLEQSEQAIRQWSSQGEPVKLTHAYLRNSVILRQESTKTGDKDYIYDSVQALLDAEKDDVVKRLLKLETLDAKNTLFALYNDSSKTLSQARHFSLASRYYGLAQSLLAELDELRPRRSADLARAAAVNIRERLIRHPHFYEVNRLDQTMDEVNDALRLADSYGDIVLKELLLKEKIPLLIGTGKKAQREEAEEIFSQCMSNARRHRLFNQIRELLYIGASFNLRSHTPLETLPEL